MGAKWCPLIHHCTSFPPTHLFFFSFEITRKVNPSDDPGTPDGDGGSLCNIHSLALALEQHVRPPFYFSIALLCMFCSGTVLLLLLMNFFNFLTFLPIFLMKYDFSIFLMIIFRFPFVSNISGCCHCMNVFIFNSTLQAVTLDEILQDRTAEILALKVPQIHYPTHNILWPKLPP